MCLDVDYIHEKLILNFHFERINNQVFLMESTIVCDKLLIEKSQY